MDLPTGVSVDDDVVRVRTTTCAGDVRLRGATVSSWRPNDGGDMLFMSRTARFDVDREVYGGIPLCLPWFGPGRNNDKPYLHGFAQFKHWSFDGASEAPNGGTVISFSLIDGYRFTYDVTMGPTLTLALSVTAGSRPLDVEQAIHTYLRTGDVRRLTLTGLEGSTYVDKTEDYAVRTQDGPVGFDGETDRIYSGPTDVVVHDPVLDRRLRIQGHGGHNTVVWNPGPEKAGTLPGFDASQWPELVCVETANVLDNSFILSPGESRTLMQTVTPLLDGN